MRRPKPWFRTSKNAWYVRLNGQQIMLAKGEDNGQAAWDAFYKLMASKPDHLPKGNELVIAIVCDLFLDFSRKHHVADTYRWYKIFLNDFCRHRGRLPALELKPFHVTHWLDSHPEWDGGRRCAITAIKRAFNWADAEGILKPNPIKSIKKPAVRRRERVLTAVERKEILAAIPDKQFREFVFALQETGARPSEVARVAAENVDLASGVWVFHNHKTAHKTGKPRVIYLTPAMLKLTRRLIAKNPAGPLFRGPRGGRPFTRNAIRCRFRRLREKLPHLKHFVCYHLRHTYATEALANGVGVAQVAELLGHSSIEMVARHYGHLAQKVDHMRDAARQATRA